MSDSKITLGLVLFPDFELLDVMGPAEMFGNLRDQIDMHAVAPTTGLMESTQKTKVEAEFSFDDHPHFDWLLVPGGWGTRDLVDDSTFLDWLKKNGEAAQLVMSVCTGSALLAKAGLLDGRNATSNKKSFKWVREQSDRVDWVTKARWVDDGNRVTSSGVSAGIDMALAVIEREFGKEIAKKMSAYTEYQRETDPHHDPFSDLWHTE
jgi:transcriptional regulator GlxA family with amidase domain